MQGFDLLTVQNVIARITHGMVGLDLFLQGKEYSRYVNDFLSLGEDELEAAMKSANANTGFAPYLVGISFPRESEILSAVKRAQQIAGRINEADTETIQKTMAELEEKVNYLYCSAVR